MRGRGPCSSQAQGTAPVDVFWPQHLDTLPKTRAHSSASILPSPRCETLWRPRLEQMVSKTALSSKKGENLEEPKTFLLFFRFLLHLPQPWFSLICKMRVSGAQIK